MAPEVAESLAEHVDEQTMGAATMAVAAEDCITQ
jgi:hypothetical protein